MTKDIRCPAQRIAWPEDLRAWVEEGILVSLVLHAVQSAVESVEEPIGSTAPLPTGSPRAVLSVLIYSYALGILSSEEIAARIPSDPNLRYLSAGARPSWHELRRFRRQWRPWVQKALSNTFQLAWEIRLWLDATNTHDRTGACDIFPASDRSAAERAFFITEAACERIHRAVMLDSMALDD